MSYSELIVSDSPLAYWELNSWTPSNPNIMSSDISTYANQYGTIFNGIKPIVAGLNQSTALSTTSASIVIPNNTSVLNIGSEKLAATVELWFNLLNSSSNTTYLIKPKTSSSNYSLFQCYLINDKLWIETSSAKNFIELINLENQQYVNISYFNGNVSMTLNGEESVSIECDSTIYSTQDQFIIGPGNGTASVHVNALALYKYILNDKQMHNRMYWARRDGTPEKVAIYDGRSIIDINYLPSTSFKSDILKSNILEYTSNIIFDGQSLSLTKIPPAIVSSSSNSSIGEYTIAASGIKFDTASSLAYIDMNAYLNTFNFSNSTIRFQFNASVTSSGTIFSIGGFDNYRAILGRVILSASPIFKLSLIDNYDNEYATASSGNLSAGIHNIAINFTTSSITLFVDGASVSSNIKNPLISGNVNSMFVGSNPNINSSRINFIGNSTFSDSTNGWYVDQGTSASIIVSYEKGYDAFSSLMIKNSSSGTVSVYYFSNINSSSPTSNMIPVTANNQYYLESKILSSSSVPVNANIKYYNSALSPLGTISVGASLTSVSSSWSTASVTGTAPASAAYAVPYFTASGTSSTASIYFDQVLMKSAGNVSLANGYNDYIRNFSIDPLTSSVVDFTRRGTLMLKFNNNLNISQTGSAQGMIRDFNKADKIIDATISYSNISSNLNIEHGKSSASVLNWYPVYTNYPLINYDFTNITADEIRVTLSTDDSWYDVPTLKYLNIKYHTSSAIYSQDAKYYITNENYSTASLFFPIINDIDSDIFSKSSNLGFKVISNITGGIKVNPSTSSISKIDFLFKVDSFSKNSTILNDGVNYVYISTTGSIVSLNPSASFYINGSPIAGGNIYIGEIYHLAAAFASVRPYVWLGYDSASRTAAATSFGNINISNTSSISIYGSENIYAAKLYNNYISTETTIVGNNLLSEQVASMELYSDSSSSWGFTSTNASATRSSASYVHGGYSVRLQPTASSVTATCQTNSSASVLTQIVPGRNYSAMVNISGNIARLASCNIIWYSSSIVSSSISISSGITASINTSWNKYTITASAPLNANYAAVQGSIQGVGLTDIIHLDEFGLTTASANNWMLPNSNNLNIDDGVGQTASTTAQNYFSSDGYYFEMLNLPKIKIVAKQSTNTNI